MALRLIEIIIPEEHASGMLKILDENSVTEHWQACSCESAVIFKILLPAEKTEKIIDSLENRFGHTENFRMVLLPVEASLPRISDTENKNGETEKNIPEETEEERVPLRVSRHELYDEVYDNARITRVFIVMVILSSIVAAIGLMRDNVAVVIGAMVIAPLLGPNVALSLANTLGDKDLGRNALKTNLTGITIALTLSLLFGFFLTVDPSTPEIASRTVVSTADIILALASGIAGALAFTTGAPTALIGVMVAVALLPPLVTFGLLLGSGNTELSIGAFLLLLTNLICVNLAGVATFFAQGIQPTNWWEASKAKKAAHSAMLLWTVLLAVLLFLIFITQGKKYL